MDLQPYKELIIGGAILFFIAVCVVGCYLGMKERENDNRRV